MANRKCNLKTKIGLKEAIEGGKKQNDAVHNFSISANTVSIIVRNKQWYQEQIHYGQANLEMKRAHQWSQSYSHGFMQ